MKTFRTMLKTELKLSIRGMDMLIFAICMPVVILVILGVICGNKPAFEGADYTFLEQSFGALVSISICGGGVMGLPLVVSDYRSKSILKRFKVTPVSPAMILAVQAVIYALYAFASLLTLYLAARLFFGYQLAGSWLQFLGGHLLVMISMFSIGMMVPPGFRQVLLPGVEELRMRESHRENPVPGFRNRALWTDTRGIWTAEDPLPRPSSPVCQAHDK